MKRVFVTVGTTKFPKLIDAITRSTTLKTLQDRGYNFVQVQTGRDFQGVNLEAEIKATVEQQGTSWTVQLADCSLTLKYHEYFEHFEEEIRAADLVISHAGAGSCLDALRLNKPLIVVINEDLMDNHQTELAKQLEKNGHVYFCVPSTLAATLRFDLTKLVPYPKIDEKLFANYLDKTVKPLVLHRSTRMQCGQTIVSVAQFTATNDKNANLQTVSRLVQNASSQGAKACDYISRNKDELIALSEPLDGPLMTAYKTLARSFNVWLSIGGFHQKLEGNRVCNSHVLINHEGTILGQYRKIHLFDVSIPDKNIHLKESDAITAGSSILPPCSTPAGNNAQCYDLRFPEQSTILRSEGADILTFPSAFTRETGQVHWEPLLKARAIENQCYVVAAAQYGEHNESRISFGQSMIIDPMGKVIAECPKYSAECPTNESIAVATIDLELVANARKNMPVFSHRRNDIYSLNTIRTKEDIKDDRMYSFADKSIPGSTVFYKSAYCFAFTNIRCVVPGHVLVSTIRRVQRLHDMTQEEIADLFQTAVKISKIMEAAYQAASSTVCVQDGEYAGQTVPQVHVHILPRKKGDFANNDDIYSRLADQDRDTNPTSRRTLQEQVEEAAYLRTFFL
ncbi:hypothetical protein YQE_09032, partial [Dendroctonus ponderosae]